MPKEGDKGHREKGSMTVEEAGRMGGEKVKAERGEGFYSEIGHKGGQRVKELIEEGKEAEQKSGKK
ncbi:MAG: Em GEA1 (EM1) [Pseudomonadota bacterium]|nr:Em GEA1 (EM1) [Pseudomonadota bacterium]